MDEDASVDWGTSLEEVEVSDAGSELSLDDAEAGAAASPAASDVDVPSSDADVEVASGIDEEVVWCVAAGVSAAGAGAPVTGSAANPETMRAGHSTVDVASVGRLKARVGDNGQAIHRWNDTIGDGQSEAGPVMTNNTAANVPSAGAPTASGLAKVEPAEERDLCQEMCDAMATLVDVIKAYPREVHGSMCIAAFRGLQMDVRPAPEAGLWNTPAPPEPRRLLPNIGEEGVYLDDQMLEFARIVAQTVGEYPTEYWDSIIGDFREEVRMLMSAL